MSTPLNAMFGLLMIIVGGLKTWLHVGSIPVLSLTTCNGKSVDLALGQSHSLAQLHCWGCYMIVAGLALFVLAVYQHRLKRRSVASDMD